MILETPRLRLREYQEEDFDDLYAILSDPETMEHYPKPYDKEGTKRWIQWNLDNYRDYGFGLWAIEKKDTGEFLGDCGITLQPIDGKSLPEIGYHIKKEFWRQGYAKEATKAVKDWVFQHTDYQILYSYMKYTNIASYRTAEANGMKKVKEYEDSKNTLTYVYAITKDVWQKQQ